MGFGGVVTSVGIEVMQFTISDCISAKLNNKNWKKK